MSVKAIFKYLFPLFSSIKPSKFIRANKKYCRQTLLEECKYVIRKNKMENLINDDLDLSSSDESDNESYNEFDNDELSDRFLKDKMVF